MLFNNDRLSHWFAGAALTWLAIFLLWALPIFHLWLKVPTTRIAIYTVVCCAMQLAVTPWLFSARATSQNPQGLFGRRAVALIAWFSATALFLFCYIPFTLFGDTDSRMFAGISFVMTILFAVLAFVTVNVMSRRRDHANH